ncbi:MAG: dihydrodipicolinate synthase family protein [Chloroflexota bacterium]|nr:dihydrodipicolinate synthase family protein [Chloroflexota bacterium]
MSLAGIYPIVPTPFDNSGRIDGKSIHRLVSFMADRGVQGLAILGVMGEAHKLSDAEQSEVIQTFHDALPNHLQLIVGVRAGGTDLAAGAARTAESLGADALLVAPPPTQNDDAIFTYYQRVADAVGIPLVVHDYPASTNVLLSPILLARLYWEIDDVQYIKLEDPPTGLKIERVRELADDGLGIFGALGGLYAFEELDRGAIGIMTGFAYPELLVELYERYRGGDRDGAATLFYDIVSLIRFEFQPGLGVSLRKHILVQRGVFETPIVRHPGTQADAKTLEHLNGILDHLRHRGYNV